MFGEPLGRGAALDLHRGGMMVRRCTRVALLAAFAVAGGCDSTPTGPERMVQVSTSAPRSGLVEITGRVIDYRTGSAMSGAVVSFRRFISDETVGEATADATGTYRVELAADTYLVHINGEGATALAVSGTAMRGDVIAGAAGCSALYGFVGDSRSSGPLSGVQVSALGLETTTNAEGWYLLDWGCESDGGFGTSIATFTLAGYERTTVPIGRGRPNGALRVDAGMLRTTAAE